jgi:hypothetical protein
MTADDFRQLALALAGAVERSHMGHPDFRANGRIFATLQADETSGGVRLPPDEQRELVRLYAQTFSPASGAWGRQGWTIVRLDAADTATVRGALMLAWHGVVEQRVRHRGPKSEAGSPKPRAQSPEPEARSLKPEAQGPEAPRVFSAPPRRAPHRCPRGCPR